MPLNWNAEKVPADIREKFNVELSLAVYNAMAVGVPELTAATLLEATHRTRLWEASFGAWNHIEDEHGQMVPDYLWKRLHLFVGLSTNATKLSNKQFLAKLWEDGVRRTAHHIALYSLEQD